MVSLGIAIAVGIWAYRKFAAPWLAKRESDIDMALLVERQNKIDSDLVAALQFESPEAKGWGSVRLEDAVIDRSCSAARRGPCRYRIRVWRAEGQRT